MFGDESTTVKQHDAFVLNCLETVNGVRKYRSKVQRESIHHALIDSDDLIVAEAYGIVKGAIIAVASKAAQKQRKCILLLCSLASVSLTAIDLLRKSDVSMLVIGNDEATKTFATRLKDDLQPDKCAIVTTFERLLINEHLTAIIHHLKTRGLLSRVIIDKAHLLLQGRGWRAAFSGLGDLRFKIGVGT